MSERKGVEIDYCPTCRGVWLDRGELDKLLEQASRETARRDNRDGDDDDDDKRRGPYIASPYDLRPKAANDYSKKRESFWSDLFDFG
jgi:Zn-finger nucleic acid-binding protein